MQPFILHPLHASSISSILPAASGCPAPASAREDQAKIIELCLFLQSVVRPPNSGRHTPAARTLFRQIIEEYAKLGQLLKNEWGYAN